MTGPRIGVAVGAGRATGVLLGGDGVVLARCALPGTGHESPGGLAAAVGAVLDRLLDAGGGERVTRVVLATSALTGALDRPGAAARVGVLRIGAPAATSVPPFTRWPPALEAAVRGPVALVRGGHEYDGREAAPLDVDAVAALGRACRGRVGAVAVTAINAPADAGHEERAVAILGDVLGPGVPIVTAREDGSVGLLERENTAVLDAALAPPALRAVEEVVREMAARRAGDDLYLTCGDGTVLPAQRAARRPVRTLGALHGSARRGGAHLLGAHLAGASRATVVDAGERRIRISSTVDGLPLESGLPLEVRGIRTSLRGLRVTATSWDGSPAAVLAQAAAGLDAAVVVVGGSAGRLPGRVLPAGAFRPQDAGYAAAIGAAAGEAAGSVDRIFWFGEGSRADSVAEARRLAQEKAVRAGADPRRLRMPVVRETLMTYVPVPCVRLRVTAVGPIMGVTRPDDGSAAWADR